MHRGGTYAGRVWDECLDVVDRGWGWIDGLWASARHAHGNERRRARTRTALSVLAILLIAAGLASSLPQTSERVAATHTYRASAWPGLLNTPAAPSPAPGAPLALAPSAASPSACGAAPAGDASGVSPQASPASPPQAANSSYRGSSPGAAGAGTASNTPHVSLALNSGGATTARLVDTLPTLPPPTFPGLPAPTLPAPSPPNVVPGLPGGTSSASNPGAPGGALLPVPAPAPAPPAPVPAVSSPAGPPPQPAPQPNPQGPQLVAALAFGAFGDSPLGSSSGIGCQLVGARQVGTVAPGETPVQAAALNIVMGLLGTPYVWGGESKSGFDCSGLMQYAFDSVGVSLPRVAQDQYDAGPIVPPGSPAVPGDLVFFGSSNQSVEHVGMVAGNGIMIDAPHTGSVVRYDRIDGFAPIVGVTSPGGQQIA